MYGKHLDQETRQIRRETEDLLREALAGRVVPSPQHPEELQESELFDAEGSQPLSPTFSHPPRAERESSVTRRESRGPGRRTSLSRCLLVSRTEEEEDEDDLGASTEVCREDLLYDSPEHLMSPLRPVKKKPRFAGQRSSDPAILLDPEGVNEAVDPFIPSLHPPRLSDCGKEAYQSAIRGLGSAKSRILTQSLAQSPNTAPDPVPKLALVPTEQYLDDDWLEDDLMELPRSRKRGRRSPSGIESREDDNSREEGMPGDAAHDRFRLAHRTPSLSRKKSRQTKLTQIVDRAVVGRTKGGGQTNASIPRLSESTSGRVPISTGDTGGFGTLVGAQ
ncbi:hypothetical protein FKM82_026356, partial [Ascaphus truei]